MRTENKKALSAATLRANDEQQTRQGKQPKNIVHPHRKARKGYGRAMAAGTFIGLALHMIVTPVTAAPTVPEYPYTQEAVQLAQEAVQDEQEAYYPLSEEERALVEAVLMSECAYEPYAGQIAVAQCILDGCEYLGIRPDECVRVYQYAEASEADVNESVKDAVSAVFDDGYRACEEDILFFYAPKWCSSPFHESQHFVMEIGGHRFFAMAG